MRLGIDVGGTNTDAVLIEDGKVISVAKVATNHADLLESVREALSQTVRKADIDRIESLNLSTTLSTNALVEGKAENVGVLVSAGPGIDPGNFRTGDHYAIIPGSIDHRGNEILSLNRHSLSEAVNRLTAKGLKVFAAVTKFSTRNPDHEDLIAAQLKGRADFVTIGHRLSGQLNFPRRIHTAYFNSAVWRIYNRFSDSIKKSLEEMGVRCPVNILKADGGTIPFSASRLVPVQTILSGPAASVMGSLAVNQISEDAIILDIGGTTTDAAIFAAGSPLLEREGISFNGLPTLVRAIRTRSIGVGGDSAIKLNTGEVEVGPERRGSALALGGDSPTLIDAFVFKNAARFGNEKKSKEGIIRLAQRHRLDPEQLATTAIENAIAKIKRALDDILEEVNQKPVYTIHELLYSQPIEPKRIYIMGGPSQAFKDALSAAFGLPVTVSRHHEVLNAIGAALTRTTMDIELFADSARRRILVPGLDIQEAIPGNYDLADARKDAQKYLSEHMAAMGVDYPTGEAQIVEAESFNMVEGVRTTGKNIRVKCQVQPGLVQSLAEES